jgi:hypothetical protein
MTTRYSLTLAQATASLRIDLNDPTGAGSRWADTDLQRALDRTLERITSVEPDLETIQIATIQACRSYPQPNNALWIDQVEYPADQWPHNYPAFTELRSPQIIAPQIAPILSSVPNGASAIDAGVHTWGYTYITVGGGETTLSPLPGITVAAATEVDLTLPIAPPDVLTTNLYRTIAGGAQFKFLDQVPATQTLYADLFPDAGLGALAPSLNTTGGIDVFRLEIPPEQYPSDAIAHTIKVRYALKHELDSLGTTLPERHWDTLYQGAMVAAVDIYLANINDNFIYADGQLRDRVDDTKSVDAWRTYRDLLEQTFAARLKQIRDEQIQSSRFTPVWGDIPLRWQKT